MNTKDPINTNQQGLEAVVASVSASVGGVRAASATGQLTRNEKQITTFKGRQSSSAVPGSSSNVGADELFVMQQVYTEDADKKFIRAVNAAPIACNRLGHRQGAS